MIKTELKPGIVKIQGGLFLGDFLLAQLEVNDRTPLIITDLCQIYQEKVKMTILKQNGDLGGHQ